MVYSNIVQHSCRCVYYDNGKSRVIVEYHMTKSDRNVNKCKQG